MNEYLESKYLLRNFEKETSWSDSKYESDPDGGDDGDDGSGGEE